MRGLFREPGDENYFIRALEYFRDNGADGVLCAGDLTEDAPVGPDGRGVAGVRV